MPTRSWTDQQILENIRLQQEAWEELQRQAREIWNNLPPGWSMVSIHDSITIVPPQASEIEESDDSV